MFEILFENFFIFSRSNFLIFFDWIFSWTGPPMTQTSGGFRYCESIHSTRRSHYIGKMGKSCSWTKKHFPFSLSRAHIFTFKKFQSNLISPQNRNQEFVAKCCPRIGNVGHLRLWLYPLKINYGMSWWDPVLDYIYITVLQVWVWFVNYK